MLADAFTVLATLLMSKLMKCHLKWISFYDDSDRIGKIYFSFIKLR